MREGENAMKLAGKIVLVTGATRGIGRALAAAFAGQGAGVIVTGRDAAALAQVQSQLPQVIAIAGDLIRPADRKAVVEAVSAQFGRLDILVNNAGIQHQLDFAAMTGEDARIDEEFGLNLIAPIQLTAACMPLLRLGREAAVINIGSPLGIVPKASAPVYCAAKAGLHVFSQALRHQLSQSGIRVVEVLPPLVETAMTAGRGSGKITAEQMAEAVLRGLARNSGEIAVGRARVLLAIHRIWPGLARRIMRDA